MSKDNKAKETFKNDAYAARYPTSIFHEHPSEHNPYLADQVECCGYNMLELISKLSYAEYLFLLATGELPDKSQADLLNRGLIAFSSPGCRHPAVRAAVAAGVGKTVPCNVLPSALLVMSGDDDGAGALIDAMRFFSDSLIKEPDQISELPNGTFGLEYGSPSIWFDRVCDAVIDDCHAPTLRWGRDFIQRMRNQQRVVGWRFSGLVAALFCDLGIEKRYAPGLMQAMVSASLVVQGMENAHRSPTILPFVKDENYDIK